MKKLLVYVSASLLVAAAAGCAPQTSSSEAPTSSGSSPIADRAEAEGWVNFVLSYDYCTGAPDPQRYSSPAMQRVIESVIKSAGGQLTAGPGNWRVSRLRDGRMETTLSFTSGAEARAMSFIIDPNQNLVIPQDSYAQQAVEQARVHCKS